MSRDKFMRALLPQARQFIVLFWLISSHSTQNTAACSFTKLTSRAVINRYIQHSSCNPRALSEYACVVEHSSSGIDSAVDNSGCDMCRLFGGMTCSTPYLG